MGTFSVESEIYKQFLFIESIYPNRSDLDTRVLNDLSQSVYKQLTCKLELVTQHTFHYACAQIVRSDVHSEVHSLYPLISRLYYFFKTLPGMIDDRLSKLSSNQDVFDQSKHTYQDALNKPTLQYNQT